MALPDIGRLLSLARKADDLFKLHDTVKDGLAAVNDRMRMIEDRLLQIETQIPHLSKASENAARAASTEALNPHLMEIGSRLSALETRLDQLTGVTPSRKLTLPQLTSPKKADKRQKKIDPDQ